MEHDNNQITKNYNLYLSALVRNVLNRQKIQLSDFAKKNDINQKFLQKIINEEVNDLSRSEMVLLAKALNVTVNTIAFPCDINKNDIDLSVDNILNSISQMDAKCYKRIDPVEQLERLSIATEKAMVISGYKSLDDCSQANEGLQKPLLQKLLKQKMNFIRSDSIVTIVQALNIDPMLLLGIESEKTENKSDNNYDHTTIKVPLYLSFDELKENKEHQSFISVQGIPNHFKNDDLKAIVSKNTNKENVISIITTPNLDVYSDTYHLYQLNDEYIITVSICQKLKQTTQIEILDRVEPLTDHHRSKIIGRLVTDITHYKANERK